jgi:hypothetical protein
MLIQILIIAFAVFALLRAFVKFRARELSISWFIFWLVFWVGLGIVVWLPQTTEIVAQWVGVGRGVDAAIYFSIVLLFYLVFRIFLKLQSIESNITKLTREEAIQSAKEPERIDDAGID